MQPDFITMTDLWNGLVGVFGTAIPLNGAQATLAEAQPPGDGSVGFTGALSGVPVAVAITQFPFEEQTGTNLSLTSMTSLPEGLRDGLYLGMAEALKEVLPQEILGKLSKLKLTPEVSAEQWISARIDMGAGGQAECLLGASRQEFSSILKQLFPDAPTGIPGQPSAILQHVSTSLAVTYGQKTLALNTLQGLATGDVILADLDAGKPCLEHERWIFALEPGPDSETPQWSIKEITMTDQEIQTAEPEAPEGAEQETVSVGDVPVRLSFATQSLNMSVGDLQGLTQGAMIPLETQSLEPGLSVRILANGSPIGDGHLVQIDDQIAVRVSNLGKQGT